MNGYCAKSKGRQIGLPGASNFGLATGQNRSRSNSVVVKPGGGAKAYRIARSAFPAARSITASVPITSSTISGWALRHPGSRGTSQRAAKAFVVVTRSLCDGLDAFAEAIMTVRDRVVPSQEK